MNIIEASDKVLQEQTCVLIRPKKSAEQGQVDCNDYQGKKKGWTILDMTTANMVKQVYNALSEKNQKKVATMNPVQTISIFWSLVN